MFGINEKVEAKEMKLDGRLIIFENTIYCMHSQTAKDCTIIINLPD